MSLPDHRLVIVTPVHEDVDACTTLFGELSNLFHQDVYVVAVDDGSVRARLNLSCLEDVGLNGVVLTLRRNVGHQRAIAIGLAYVSEFMQPGQHIVTMDADGEDRPSTIPDLLRELDAKDVDVVVAQRRSRVETRFFKLFYSLYCHFFHLMTGRTISFGNFLALKSAAVRRLVAMQELSIHVAASVLASKLRTVGCSIDRGPRYSGNSKMNFVGLVLHGFKGLMVFAEDVLVRVGIACASIAGISVAGALLAIGLKLVGFSTPGWFSLAFGILLLIFLQTGTLALMTLMLTGVVRGGTVTTNIAYHEFIESVAEAKPRAKLP